MTNPAEKIPLDTHGTKTRNFTPVEPAEPALRAAKAMVAPAEKIRQVVVDYQHKLWDVSVSFTTNLNLLHRKSQEVLREALTAQLDAIIEEMELRKDEKLYESTKLPPPNDMAAGYNGAMTEWIWKLKEARSSLDSGGTSITNSTNE